MKSKTVILCLLAVFLLFVVICGTAYSKDTITVTGVLTNDFAIQTDDGNLYEVDLNETAVKMFETVKGRLSVTGTLVDSDLGPLFKVQSFKALE